MSDAILTWHDRWRWSREFLRKAMLDTGVLDRYFYYAYLAGNFSSLFCDPNHFYFIEHFLKNYQSTTSKVWISHCFILIHYVPNIFLLMFFIFDNLGIKKKEKKKKGKKSMWHLILISKHRLKTKSSCSKRFCFMAQSTLGHTWWHKTYWHNVMHSIVNKYKLPIIIFLKQGLNCSYI